MNEDDNDLNSVADAWINQLEYAVRRTESLSGFYRLSCEERRPGGEVDAFFHGRTELELIDCRSYLQLVQMKWERVKTAIDLSKLKKRRMEKIREIESRMEGALRQGRELMPRRDMQCGPF